MKKQNKEEANELIQAIVKSYGRLNYNELRTWIEERKMETKLVTGNSGVKYQVELTASWDDKPEGIIRFSGSIYDDSKSLFLKIKTPISYDILTKKG